MTERRTEEASTEVSRREDREEIMTSIETTEITVRPAAQSFHDYIAARVDLADLSTEEIVELTFAFHAEWQSSDERKSERESAKVEREAKAAAGRAAREAARKERLEAERVALEAKLAKLSK